MKSHRINVIYSQPRCSFICRLFFCYTALVAPTHHRCSHPQVVTCNYNHVAHNPFCLIFGGFENTLILPDCQQKVSHSALCPFSPLSSVLPCWLILLHQLTFKVKHAFECSFCIASCVTLPPSGHWVNQDIQHNKAWSICS